MHRGVLSQTMFYGPVVVPLGSQVNDYQFIIPLSKYFFQLLVIPT